MRDDVEKDLPPIPEGDPPKAPCECKCKRGSSEEDKDAPEATREGTALSVYWDING